MGARKPPLNQASCGSQSADHGQKHHPDAGKPLARPSAHAAVHKMIRNIEPALARLRAKTSLRSQRFRRASGQTASHSSSCKNPVDINRPITEAASSKGRKAPGTVV